MDLREKLDGLTADEAAGAAACMGPLNSCMGSTYVHDAVLMHLSSFGAPLLFGVARAVLNELLDANGLTRDQLISGEEEVTHLEMFLQDYDRVRCEGGRSNVHNMLPPNSMGAPPNALDRRCSGYSSSPGSSRFIC
jgi:hypothetical protein